MFRIVLFCLALLSSITCIGQTESKVIFKQNFDTDFKATKNISVEGAKIVGKKNNKAIFFDGVDDLISLNIPHLNTNKDFSISIWVAPSRYKLAASWVTKSNLNQSKSQFRFGFGWPPHKRLNFTFYDNFWQDEFIKHTLPLHEWTHLIYTLSPKNKKGQLYINGKIAHEYELKQYMPSTEPVFLGLQWDDYIFYHGYIDEFVVYNKVIADSEVEKLYTYFTNTEKVNVKPKLEVVPNNYTYSIPKKYKDKIRTGDIRKINCDHDSIFSIINNQLQDNSGSLESLLIYKGDQLVLEEYFHGYTSSTLHGVSSVTKSFASTILGIAIDKGLIKSEETSLVSYYPEASKNMVCLDSISLKDVLNQKSGLFPAETDHSLRTQQHWVSKVLSGQTKCNIGKFKYNELNPEIVIHTALKNSNSNDIDFADKYLFKPLGIKNYYWLKDQTGTIDGGTGLAMRPRDMLKFGILYKDKGVFAGKRILSENWIHKATGKNVTDFKYNYFWWRLNKEIKGHTIYMYSAKGFGHQTINIVPKLDLIIVTTCSPNGKSMNSQGIIEKKILPAFLENKD